MRPIAPVAKCINLHIPQLGSKCDSDAVTCHPAHNSLNRVAEDPELNLITPLEVAWPGEPRTRGVDIQNPTVLLT